MTINEINSYLVKNKKEITTTGVGVIQTLATIALVREKRQDIVR